MGKLTETVCKRAKWEGKNYHLTDGGGLSLEVRQSSKLWRWQYRYHGEKRLMALGEFPTVSLADARNKHIDGRRLLDGDIDAMAERKSEKIGGTTFKDVALAWLENWKHGKKPRYAAQQEQRLRANILPYIGTRQIADIEVRELVAMCKAVEKHAPVLAKRALNVVGMVYRYAIAHSLAKRNPARDVNPGDFLRATVVANQARVSEKELPALLDAIDAYRGDQTRLAFRLIALVFLRPSELVGGRWDEIDFAGSRWDIPAIRMKGKEGKRRDHVVPLSRQATAILEQLRKDAHGSEYIFPGQGKAKHMASGTFLHALERMGYKGKQTAHGFRGIASTILHEHSFDHLHIEAQLAHVEGGVSGHYNKAEYLEQRRRMMQWYADYLDARQHGAQVIVGKFGTA